VLLIEPVKHRGKAALTPVVADARGQLGCNFQRQRYDLCFSAGSSSNKEAFEACVGRGKENGALVLVTCPVNRPVGHYTTHPGLNPTTTAQRLEAYGRNVVSVGLLQMLVCVCLVDWCGVRTWNALPHKTDYRHWSLFSTFTSSHPRLVPSHFDFMV
jgi:hypothetical protein